MTEDKQDETIDRLEQAKTQFQIGKAAFDRGRYSQAVAALEQAVELAGRFSLLGGEVQISLVTAYQAAGKSAEAIALGEQLTQHPDVKIRKQSRRLIYILKAPALKPRPEWLTEIPDLTKLEGAESQVATRYGAAIAKAPARSAPRPAPVEVNPSSQQDNRFIWIALVATALVLAGLIWFS